MIRFLMRTGMAEGRIISEDADLMRIELLSGGIIGYQVKDLKNPERLMVTPAQYQEKVGDCFSGQLWDFEDDLDDYARARTAYRRSLDIAPDPGVEKKLEKLTAEREELQKELLRRKEVEAAEERAETARLDREAVEQELKQLKELEEMLKHQSGLLDKIVEKIKDSDQTDKLLKDRTAELKKDLDDLADEVHKMSRRITALARRADGLEMKD